MVSTAKAVGVPRWHNESGCKMHSKGAYTAAAKSRQCRLCCTLSTFKIGKACALAEQRPSSRRFTGSILMLAYHTRPTGKLDRVVPGLYQRLAAKQLRLKWWLYMAARNKQVSHCRFLTIHSRNVGFATVESPRSVHKNCGPGFHRRFRAALGISFSFHCVATEMRTKKH